MPVLAALGYRVWAPNQRGYGGTTRPARMQEYSLENLTADVAGMIDASGATEVVLLGHDWGGIVAWTFALRAVRPLRRLVILNVPHPAAYLRCLRRPSGFGQMLRSWYVGAFQLARLPEWMMRRNDAAAVVESIVRSSDRFPAELLEAVRANALEPGALTAMVNWYRAYVRGGGLRRQQALGYPVIQTPTLLLWGDQDRFLSTATTRHTEDYVADLTVTMLPGVSHWVQQDAPEAVADALRAFLAVG